MALIGLSVLQPRSLMLLHKPRFLLSPVRFLLLKSKSIPLDRIQAQRFFSTEQSWLTVPGNPLIDWPSPIPDQTPNPNQTMNLNPRLPADGISQDDFSTIASLFIDPAISPGSALETALDRTGIEPSPTLLQTVFDQFDSSPKLLHSLFIWSEKQPGFRTSEKLFNSMVKVLAKSKEFDSAWTLILNEIDRDKQATLLSVDTFAIMIRRYARAGNITVVDLDSQKCSKCYMWFLAILAVSEDGLLICSCFSSQSAF